LDKRDVVSAIDRGFFGEILPRIDLARTVVAVTADHSTSCVRKAHTADPVPLLVSGGPVGADGSETFGESACRGGSLGELLGPRILPRIVETIRG
jgi:2,3-bisphosphoglycerate-independent phosphoglycerate mutase